ncbi:Ig-like domain-containing protein [Streptomyces sp. AK02-01A]|uniref:Ig-like domain-containing protein n=1 Tax=Streptomyces sp. AK02-01A TaxID=3028648 RepID=UPI0029BED304|nr:Ig-like domain-containing protein [Streptomyces sp. AK02-01A]MDX3852156.1 Ig-like domain-containing protein [Streptomyces sp. AK02-01A]
MKRLARARTLPALLMCCALLMTAAAAVLGVAATASAAGRLGDLTLSQTSGSINDNPLIPHLSTDAACPEGQGEQVSLTVLKPDDGTPAKLGDASEGGYDTGPVEADMAETIFLFTFATALSNWYGEGPYDGTYELRLECVSILDPNKPEAFFGTNIKVTGDTWALAEAQSTSVELTASPADHPVHGSEVTFTARVSPATAAGEITLTSERVSGEPVPLGRKAVADGAAVFTTAELPAGVQNITAQFTPTDPDAYAASVAALNGYTVDDSGSSPPPTSPPPSESEPPTEPADLDVVDAEGNPLGANPDLAAGRQVTITARGYGEDAAVKVSLSDSEAALPDATANADGTVEAYAFTVPDGIADGDHVLTLAEDTEDGHSVAFAFTTGGEADPGPDPSDTTGTDGGTSADGGASAGSAGGAASGASGGSGGGSLASTGTGVAAIGLSSLALTLVGAAFVISARRGGLLTFTAPGPAGSAGPAGD